MRTPAFETPIVITGPLRKPRQMLAEQSYDGHESIHDDAMAAKLGFAGAPIEGPTHFSQFDPLLVEVFGKAWFERGCISSHYLNMVVEGEEVRATVEVGANPRLVRIYASKSDGTPVLEGTASLGPDHPESVLDERLRAVRPPAKLVILRDVQVGDRSRGGEQVVMDFDQHLGSSYPFTLSDKLAKITEPSPWYTKDDGARSPWGRPIIPFEMISVLAQFTSGRAGWKVRTPHVGLFADLEIRMLAGPLFVGKPYELDREVVGLGETRRTESMWVRTNIRDPESGSTMATVLLNHAIVKSSFPDYDKG